MDETDKCDVSYEPMDVDLSLSINSVKSLNCSSTDDLPQVLLKKDIKVEKVEDDKHYDDTEHINKKRNNKHEEKNSCVKKFHINIPSKKKPIWSRANFLFISAIVLSLSLLSYYITDIKCSESLHVGNIRNTLSGKLYGQQNAIQSLVKTLNQDSRSKLIFLYGGTGVGKTYTASLILNNTWSFSNIYHFTMPSFKQTFASSLLVGVIMCKSSVFFIDNLSGDDDISEQVRHVVEKSEKLGKDVTIFLLYNCDTVASGFVKSCDSEFVNKLWRYYETVKAPKEFIKYEQLAEEHLRKCIEDEIGDRRVSDSKMDDILRNFDVSADGCKSVHSRMKFLNTL